jgi:agmatinase
MFDPSSAALHEGIYGLPSTLEQSGVVLVPVPWEATVSYGAGTADGPAAILKSSRQVDLLDRETGRPYEAGIAMLPIPADVRAWSDAGRRLALPVIEAGGPGADPGAQRAVAEVDALGERMNAWVHAQASAWLQRDRLVGVVGGSAGPTRPSCTTSSASFPTSPASCRWACATTATRRTC